MSGFSSLFKAKRVTCVCCNRSVKDKNLAKIVIKTGDGEVLRKVCKDCEVILNGVSKDG